MIVKCPKCLKIYEQAKINPGVDFCCSCGQKFLFESEQIFSQLKLICKEYELKLEEKNIAQIRKTADRIVSLILNNNSTQIDIDIEKQKLRQLIEQISPERVDLYELIYVPRFKRLWNQFRGNSDT